ncbi:MAG: hypothetical protein Q7J16_06065, partial [Candidatus Cloacimonadales bacterium]|nr:hypothetical protein [Candidatus Cloacimonadales bacterium]
SIISLVLLFVASLFQCSKPEVSDGPRFILQNPRTLVPNVISNYVLSSRFDLDVTEMESRDDDLKVLYRHFQERSDRGIGSWHTYLILLPCDSHVGGTSLIG